jgi:hypothetical protein
MKREIIYLLETKCQWKEEQGEEEYSYLLQLSLPGLDYELWEQH